MDWKGRRQSDNIEDRRGTGARGGNPFGRGGMRLPSGGMRASGLSFKTILILGVIFLVLKLIGIDPLQMLGADPGAVTGQPSASGSQISETRRDEMTQFVATVLAETEDVWNGIMKAQGMEYPEPTLVLFSGAVSSACGNASAASGPFYCPGDQKLYIDLSFYDELSQRFKASGDFAQAYVLAHEVGHHVQNLIGVLPKFNQMRQSMTQAEENQMSIRVELQADCFAGIWGHYTAQKGILESGDLEEALNAAQQIGDDTLQRRTQGYVVPESFNHGTSAQRKEWFARGFDSGRLAACDTFNNPV
ncbi:flagellar biosynthesis anti-sigma factor FlgM [Hoeflea sp. BAL378]|uniref:KPN_02809 family neutral zinc metallopeptidase n=1 Tax=Hoeflea sp. BAL378 TaxID=1547437 RepID=UPI0005131374|nr:neutral zinc metallopeptidase [Hoeflea sp. BAL378]KGF68858.1 flagellar biosynthesis anti-sigma factor FlgM [Hoeflea sp. BAL378]